MATVATIDNPFCIQCFTLSLESFGVKKYYYIHMIHKSTSTGVEKPVNDSQ